MKKPLMFQKWRDLFFLHWRMDPQIIQKTLPKGLLVDTFQGNAFLGIVPFKIFDARPIYLPPLPGISNFLEINLRTYVLNNKKEPGIWFYSLDANCLIDVYLGRLLYKLPYIYSEIKLEQNKTSFDFTLKRKSGHAHFHMKPHQSFFLAKRNTLEHFFIERYRLFAVSSKKVIYETTVSHPPYQLASAELISMENDLFFDDLFFVNENKPYHMLYSPGVDVQVPPLQRCP